MSRFSESRAHQTQLRLSKLITCEDELPEKIRFVAGVDVGYTANTSIGAVAVLDFDSLEVVESQTASCVTRVPYIPTLLAFRETQPSLLSIRKLHVKPDVFLVDGHGVAHPYHCGFASHLGIVLGKPTIGVAKRKLFGEFERPILEDGVALLKQEDEVIGAAVTTKRGSKPVYVSAGHKISLETAIETVGRCSRDNRVPEPIRRAHQVAVAEKRKSNID